MADLFCGNGAGKQGPASANGTFILDTLAPLQAATITTISANTGTIQGLIAEQLKGLPASTYYANLSVFRSAPNTWAIDQLFPVLPIHRLDEKPEALGSFADLTCDSNGKIARFIDPAGHSGRGQVKPLLELHNLRPGSLTGSACSWGAPTSSITWSAATPTPRCSKRWSTTLSCCWNGWRWPALRVSERRSAPAG